jgi:hypothetical protein
MYIHDPGTVIGLLVFSAGCLLVRRWWSKRGTFYGGGLWFKRDEHPRLFAIALHAMIGIAAFGLVLAVAAAIGLGPNFTFEK